MVNKIRFALKKLYIKIGLDNITKQNSLVKAENYYH